MQPTTRREFLVKSSAAGLSFLAVPSWLRAADAPQPAGTPAGAGPLDMTIARWAGGEVPADLATRLTEQAVATLGGMSRFVSRGSTVWVKPNIGWNRKPEFAANTHPDVVAAVVRMCFDAGAKSVKVGDFPCNEPKACYENSGIAPAAKAVGADIVYLDQRRFRKMAIGGNRLKDHPVYPDIVECDLVINVPVCKHHGGSRVTLCMKNYMGVVDDRRTFHQDLPTTIADITQFMKPRLCILDATRILTDHGPTGGKIEDVKTLNTVAAGVDIVALDAFGSELLGKDPRQIETVTKGAEYGLGRVDYRSLALKELSLS
ncbi:MAG TPA: DUF362 domain-containing protein [Phycisphaerae bacterium]|nr:DUF362 domain-containing protein [Phycisphaerae bacterium]